MTVAMLYAGRCGVLVHALLIRTSLAELRTADMLLADEEPDADTAKVKGLTSNEDKICGGPEIWREVTKDQTPTGVQNIKWQKIGAIAEEYIKQQEMRLQTIRNSLVALAERIKQARAKESIQDATGEQLHSLITVGAKAFGGVADAKRTNCGSPQVRPRAPRGAFKQSVEDFRPEAEKVFQKSVKLGRAPLLEVCQELLACENAQATCYCERLCQQFRDIAQKVSDKSVGEHAGGADDMVRKENTLQEELTMRQTEITECQNAKQQLGDFGDQIGRLKGKAHERFEILQDAEEALYDAQEDLADLEDGLKEQEAAETAALAVLKGATGQFDQATAALKALSSEEAALLTRVNDNVAALGAARREMDAAMGADRSMAELRELVSVTVMKMEMFFDQVVQAPVRGLGIDKDLDLSTVFVDAPEEMTSAGAVREAVDSLARYCSEDGKEAIESMKGRVDLAPLCSLAPEDKIKEDINKAVAVGLRSVKSKIEKVKGWLNPYRGQDRMNDETAEAFVHEGEPVGLRRIISTYGSTGFYRQYLRSWKLGGPFLELLHKVRETAYSLQQTVEDMGKTLAGLKGQLAKTVAARQAAEAELEKATKDQSLAQGKQTELKAHVEQMRTQGEKMKKSVEDLEAQVKDAQQKYKAALDKIKAAHAESTSFLESWRRSEALEELRAETARARDRLMSSRIEADQAEQAYLLAVARESEVEQQGSEASSRQQAVVSDHRLHRQ